MYNHSSFTQRTPSSKNWIWGNTWKKQSDYSSKVYGNVKSCKNEHLKKTEKTTKLLGTDHEFSERKA